MIFNEWFKNPADKEARKEAELLEKNARLKLREEKNLPMFDSLESDEIKADILFNYPKTNDDDMREYAAGTIIINSDEYEKVSGGQDLEKDFIEDTAKIMVNNLKTDHESIAEKEKKLLDLKQELFISERRLLEARVVLVQYSKSAFAQQDEFYTNKFREADEIVKSLEEKNKTLEITILDLEKNIEHVQTLYQAALDRYYAITGELMPHEQDRLEEQN